jgi:hypothetical protein
MEPPAYARCQSYDDCEPSCRSVVYIAASDLREGQILVRSGIKLPCMSPRTHTSESMQCSILPLMLRTNGDIFQVRHSVPSVRI